MKRIPLFLSPIILAAVAFAQEAADSAADLAQKLGHDDYAVREAATKKLIELGEQAVPELEQALKSDDLEVRLRAGRALRAIRGVKPNRTRRKPEPRKPGDPMGPGGKVVGTSLSVGNGHVKLKVTRVENGKRVTKEYNGTSIEELKKNHPELKGLLGNFHVVVGGNPFRDKRLRLDMDKFWKDFNKDFGKDFNDEFWKNWQKDLQKESDRLRRLSERWGRQWEAQRGVVNRNLFGPGRTLLGVTAMQPSDVLDAQLGLRGRGVVIRSVTPNSLAAKLKLERYDVLLELNGMAIRTTSDIAVALRQLAMNRKAGREAKPSAKIVRRAAVLKLPEAPEQVKERELVPAPAKPDRGK